MSTLSAMSLISNSYHERLARLARVLDSEPGRDSMAEPVARSHHENGGEACPDFNDLTQGAHILLACRGMPPKRNR